MEFTFFYQGTSIITLSLHIYSIFKIKNQYNANLLFKIIFFYLKITQLIFSSSSFLLLSSTTTADSSSSTAPDVDVIDLGKDGVPNHDIAALIYTTCSTKVLSGLIAEPPDIALIKITHSLNDGKKFKKKKDELLLLKNEHNKKIRMKKTKKKKNQNNIHAIVDMPKCMIHNSAIGAYSATTKGERLYKNGPQPKNVIPLPLSLKKKQIIKYDIHQINLRKEVIEFLHRNGK